jgi:hypothetical protein
MNAARGEALFCKLRRLSHLIVSKSRFVRPIVLSVLESTP